ncbi:2-methylcitrate dehydratase [Mycolicibacterium canariasense]|uniref:2-methylcitrate dehydratase n=2 Tax=Mycolicibacterium canariasense TaxID=228230 RepID=A0A100WHS1_MYCCR|nr:2-methylcitrate dehydratase [Mycolicibacterium canariasense]
MVINRIIDNAAVAAAAARRHSVALARAQARPHRRTPGAAIFGIQGAYSAEWAALANSVAVQDLELHDVFPAAEDAHPGAAIPALTAVAQQAGLRGADLVNGIATAYDVHLALAQQTHSRQQVVGHPGPLSTAVTAGLGAMLRLSPATIYTALTHTVQLTARGRNGYAAAYAGKVAIEAVDRAVHGERYPDPPEGHGHDWPLTDRDCRTRLPEPGEPRTAILNSCPRRHPAAYSVQAWIDLALKMRDRIGRVETIDSIVLHTRQDTDPMAVPGDSRLSDHQESRDVLAHSVAYLFAVALQDGAVHHEQSYTSERAQRADTVDLRRQISFAENAAERTLGARATITMKSGAVIDDELAVPYAHPRGAHPFRRNDYVAKFTELADGIIDRREQQRFLDVATCLVDLKRGTLGMLNPLISQHILDDAPSTHGIFA